MKKKCIWLAWLSLVLIETLTGCQFEQLVGQETKPTSGEAQSTLVKETVSSSPLSSPVELPSVLNSPITQPSPQITPTFPSPADGKAAIRGALIISSSQTPLPETQFYLIPAIGDRGDQLPSVLAGPQENDLWGFTDKQGWFALNDIPPDTYFLAIWAPLNWVILSKLNESGSEIPVPIKLKPNQVIDLGKMTINWP